MQAAAEVTTLSILHCELSCSQCLKFHSSWLHGLHHTTAAITQTCAHNAPTHRILVLAAGSEIAPMLEVALPTIVFGGKVVSVVSQLRSGLWFGMFDRHEAGRDWGRAPSLLGLLKHCCRPRPKLLGQVAHLGHDPHLTCPVMWKISMTELCFRYALGGDFFLAFFFFFWPFFLGGALASLLS